MEKAGIKKVLSTIEKQVNVKFVYSSSNINTAQLININVTNKRLDQVLNELLLPLSVEYLVKENRIILRSNQEVGSSLQIPIWPI
jgi:light-regulated signal transduction histidine kinase (bacteriophytochrome)